MIVTAIRVTVAALCMVAVVASAADKAEKSKKGEKITTPATVTPQGGIGFGESKAPTPADLRRAWLRWPAMTQKEIDGLTAMLKAVKNPAPVQIVCKDPACEDLALNLDNAFESAKWKSNVMIGTQFGVPEGVSGSSHQIVNMFNLATGGRYDAKVETVKSADGEYLLIGAKPR